MNFKAQIKQRHIQTLTDLLKNGFTLPEAIAVMERSGHFHQERLARFRQLLISGETLGSCFTAFGFTPQEIAQIQLAQYRGDLPNTLASISQQMTLTAQQRKELQKTLAYPLLLIVFVASLMLGMRQFLLPQLLQTQMMSPDHWGVRFLQGAPYWFLRVSGGGLVIIFLTYWKLKSWSVMARSAFWSRWPLFGGLYSLFITSYFALEWGKLFQEGLELRQIIQTLQRTEKKGLMYQLAQEIDQGLNRGESLVQQLGSYPFLTAEFSLIVFQGESKGRLGEELVLYSQLTQRSFYEGIQRYLHFIQPLIFVLVALLIVSIYGALFLPLYSNLNNLM